ncbi:TPA: TIGR03750 family conjugal transfer protein [Pasteurella multocida]|uniref:TIGR03750 family conjugal transfer protein n=1 Tax=Pasteurella multocida TaxID=747 RepID=UPI00202104AC|nr:TIGR03750 family conjugal transfer protein [Pasteurella multocida]MCL7827373.1 TIGR03750 family conjugal transfer protein [Pasteurella multocida]HDR1435565.1 TIGR03750 family conjugal transfer protein [Pasteurella multocida]HDR1793423.1 TIGR03750 family conjugal transfer protein [Pasteurella multocida]HDR1868178.1 TIGR03750 family conjugal transfer protein [Pasteurella multocida]HED4416805.1 TIGR03750 family conjugal transfer protein [Pasteurella multocida]
MRGEDIDFLPNRLNRQPVIYRGMTNTEIFTLAGIGALIGCGVGILVAILFGEWVLIPTFILISPLITIFFGSKTIARLKRGKPDTWLPRYLEWTKAKWLSNPYFINPKGITAWSIRRQANRRTAK